MQESSLSVFGTTPFPTDKVPSAEISSTESLGYAKPHIRVDGETLILDDRGGCSRVSVILIGQTEPQYLSVAKRQEEYLLKSALRFRNGAISHRRDVVGLWAEFGLVGHPIPAFSRNMQRKLRNNSSMVPPFFAYYSVASNDLDVMKEAFLQCTLYREILLNNSSGSGRGLWHHIVGPENRISDSGAPAMGERPRGWLVCLLRSKNGDQLHKPCRVSRSF